MNAGRKTAVYARQSLDIKDSLSIETQIELCTRFAGGPEPVVYVDRGFSGKNIKRPEFQRMLRDVEQDCYEKVIVYKLDRFSRSVADFIQTWDILSRHQTQFVSINESFDTSTPMGRATILMIAVFAQLERETIALRVTDNYYARVKDGRWPGGPAPYGFRNGRITLDGKQHATLLPGKPEEIQTVQNIFVRYVRTEESLGSVARRLNAAGVEAPGGRGWNSVAIRRTLQNPAYVRADSSVYYFFQKKGCRIESSLLEFDGQHAVLTVGKRRAADRKRQPWEGRSCVVANFEGTVDAALWIAANEKLLVNKQLPRRNMGKHSWLTGLLKCASCQSALVITVNEDGARYLNCSGHRNHVCEKSFRAVPCQEVEAAVEQEIKALLTLGDTKEQEIFPENGAEKSTELRLREIERQLGNIAENFILGVPSAALRQQLAERAAGLEAERKQLLPAAKKEANPLAVPRLDWDAMSYEEKKLTARTFLRRVVVDANRAVSVEWQV